MITIHDTSGPEFDFDRSDIEERYNRTPFGFTHELHRLDLFSPDSLRALADAASTRDHFVASSAPKPETDFYAVDHGKFTPSRALADLDRGRHRILIKRPETFDARFRRLLDATFARIVSYRPELRDAKLTRLEGTVLVSSADAITPFHFDPEVSFFFHIEGEKIYHLYPPDCVAETELERFYKKNIVNIGQLDLGSRDRSREHVFPLVGGKGLHQPHNAPHWVETRGSRSVSYVVAFETEKMHELAMTRAFNHYVRKTGLSPERPGTNARADAMKARAMDLALPLRRKARETLRAVTRR
jgi:hypothetical protein